MTHIVFDAAHNVEGVTFTTPADGDRHYYPDGTELRVYTGLCGDGALSRDDIRRLRDALTAHLNEDQFCEQCGGGCNRDQSTSATRDGSGTDCARCCCR